MCVVCDLRMTTHDVPTDRRRLYSVEQVAGQLNVSRAAVYKIVKRGDLPVTRRAGPELDGPEAADPERLDRPAGKERGDRRQSRGRRSGRDPLLREHVRAIADRRDHLGPTELDPTEERHEPSLPCLPGPSTVTACPQAGGLLRRGPVTQTPLGKREEAVTQL